LLAKGALREIVNLQEFKGTFIATQVDAKKRSKVRKAVAAITSDAHWFATENFMSVLEPLYVAMMISDSKVPTCGSLHCLLYQIFSSKAHAEAFKNLLSGSPHHVWFKKKADEREENLMSDVV
jgi:uncharacterized protein YbbK (DUF523 family)